MNALFDERRAAQAAAFLLFMAGGCLSVLKLMKLLYLAERRAFLLHGEPITGDRLVSMPHGPVLSMTYERMCGIGTREEGGWSDWVAGREGNMLSLRDPSMIRSPAQDLLRLSESDLKVLQATWDEFGHMGDWALRDYTHSGACPEWQDPEGSSQPISYQTLFRHLGYSQDVAEALQERLSGQAALSRAFSQPA
jgi:uncharacterized phage-associated protein